MARQRTSVPGSHCCSNLLSHHLALMVAAPRRGAGLAGVLARTSRGRGRNQRGIRGTETGESPNLEGRPSTVSSRMLALEKSWSLPLASVVVGAKAIADARL